MAHGKTMKASRIHRHGGADELKYEDAPVPEPGPGEVLIRVAAAGVNPADYKHRSGMFKAVIPYVFPKTLGYDAAGVVVAHGAGVSEPALGARVTVLLEPRRGGGYAQFVATPASGCAILPATMDFETAAVLPCAALTGAQMVEEHLGVQPGETIIVTGATGMVGRFAVRTALRLGARVVAAVRKPYFGEASTLGVAGVVALDEPWTGPLADAMADTVGGTAAAMLAHGIKPAGRIVTIATDRIDPAGLTVEPRFIAVHPDGAGLATLVEDVAAGLVSIPIAARFPLDEAGAAQELIERGGVRGKIVLRVD